MTARLCVETPHHLTAFFRPVPAPDPLQAGSLGAGIVVEPAARLCVGAGPIEGEPPWHEAPPHLKLAASRLGVEVGGRASMPLPPGRGYAVSAAAAILGALAAAALRGLPVSRALREAHRVEVEMKTGLGDVPAISCGVGVAVRLSPGPPGSAIIECMPLPSSLVVVVGEGGSMATGELLSALKSEDWAEASRSLHRLASELSAERFLEEALRYTRARRLDERMLGFKLSEVLPSGGVASYYVKKKLAVVVAERDSAVEVASRLAASGLRVRVLTPSRGPPRVVY